MMDMMKMTKTENRGRPTTVFVNEQFIKDYETKSNKQLAKDCGVTVSAIQKAARKAGLKGKTEGGRPCSMPDADELRELCKYHTDKEIAKIHDVCPGTVAYWRKKLGISKYTKIA